MDDFKGDPLEKLVISPSVWPGKSVPVQPGDLSKFAPYGNGFYGLQSNAYLPIVSDPPQEPSAGIVYFGNGVTKPDFEGFLRMMEVRANDKDYAAFIHHATNPMSERFLTQIRFVSKFALQFAYEVLNEHEYERFPKQELSLGDAMWEFMEHQRRKYGTGFGDGLSLMFGGDGDFAQEELSFGFMLENQYFDISRIWSRGWLVTK